MGNGKGHCLRAATGPSHHSEERPGYELVLLEKLKQEVQPTPEELALCRRAASRWGKKAPTPDDILGDRPRPGLQSIVSLIALRGDAA